MNLVGNRDVAARLWMLSLGIGAALIAPAAVSRAFAQRREEIDEQGQPRIQHAEHDLHEAIEHHGRDSRQAEHERHELHEARAPMLAPTPSLVG